MTSLDYNTIIIGAGPAGINCSLALNKKQINHVVIEKGSLFHSWKSKRWDSFMLNTPHGLSRLLYQEDDIPDDKLSLPFATSLRTWEDHVRKNELPIWEKTTVVAVEECNGDSALHLLVHCTQGNKKFILKAKNVIGAVGPFHESKIPDCCKSIPGVKTFAPGTYANPDQLSGATLVVGSGQTGVQLANQIAAAGKEVYLATSKIAGSPRSFRTIDVVKIYQMMGAYAHTKDSFPDPDAFYDMPVPIFGASGPLSYFSLYKRGVRLLGRLRNVSDGPEGKPTFHFDGDLRDNVNYSVEKYNELVEGLQTFVKENQDKFSSDLPPYVREDAWEDNDASFWKCVDESPRQLAGKIENIVYACGWKANFSWVKVERVLNDFGKAGLPINMDTPHPGFFWVGMPFCVNRGSSYLVGFPDDARIVVDKLRK